MRLTAEQLKNIAKGVENWETGPEGGLIPHRFSALQRQIYSADRDRYLRTQASAGVRLMCRTDAAALELSVRIFPGSGQELYGFDLLVDGCLYRHREGRLQDGDRLQWTQPLPPGEKQVTLYLPCLTGVEILGLTLKNATYCKRVDLKEKILFMGDSITQGYISHFPSMTYPAQVAAYRNADFLNQGNGGEVFHPEILAPLDWKPTMAVISYGTNDWSKKDKSRFIQDAEDFLDQFAQIWSGLPTVVLTPIWRADYLTRRTDDFRFVDVRTELQKLADRHESVQVISGFDLVPHAAEMMADARIHPNELGFVLYAKRLCEALDSLLPVVKRKK